MVDATVKKQLEQVLAEAVSRLEESVEIERLLAMRVRKCMDLLDIACRSLVNAANSQLITYERLEGAVSITAHDRVLTFTPALGVASDARLHRARGHACSQVLCFLHNVNQDESSLLTSFRIYADGLASDGEHSWKLDNESSGLSTYLTELVASSLLDCQVYWPDESDLPQFTRIVPVQNNRLDIEPLRKSCIGFECNLQHNRAHNEKSGTT